MAAIIDSTSKWRISGTRDELPFTAYLLIVEDDSEHVDHYKNKAYNCVIESTCSFMGILEQIDPATGVPLTAAEAYDLAIMRGKRVRTLSSVSPEIEDELEELFQKLDLKLEMDIENISDEETGSQPQEEWEAEAPTPFRPDHVENPDWM